MSTTEEEVLANIIRPPELPVGTVSEKYHLAQMEKLKRDFAEEKRKLDSKIWHMQKDVARAGNIELTAAYSKLETKCKNLVEVRQDLERKNGGMKDNCYRLTLERDFLKNRILAVYKKEGFRQIISHIDCPQNLKNVLELV